MNSYDFLKHLTVYLEGSENENAAAGFNISATGFYAVICIGDKQVPVVITVRHFAEKVCLTRFILHSNSDGEILTLPLIMRANWILSDDCDLAYCKLLKTTYATPSRCPTARRKSVVFSQQMNRKY